MLLKVLFCHFFIEATSDSVDAAIQYQQHFLFFFALLTLKFMLVIYNFRVVPYLLIFKLQFLFF